MSRTLNTIFTVIFFASTIVACAGPLDSPDDESTETTARDRADDDGKEDGWWDEDNDNDWWDEHTSGDTGAEGTGTENTDATDTEATGTEATDTDTDAPSEPDYGTPTRPVEGCDDGNDTMETAMFLPVGAAAGHICSGEDDFFAFYIPEAREVTVALTFWHREGDLDMELRNEAGTTLDASTSGDDRERIEQRLAAGEYFIRIYGYDGAANPDYILAIMGIGAPLPVDDPIDGWGGGNSTSDGNDSIEESGWVDPGDTRIDAIDFVGDEDFYMLDLGSNTVTVVYDPAVGDIDIEITDHAGRRFAASTGTTGTELLSTVADRPLFLRIYGTNSGTGEYRVSVAN